MTPLDIEIRLKSDAAAAAKRDAEALRDEVKAAREAGAAADELTRKREALARADQRAAAAERELSVAQSANASRSSNLPTASAAGASATAGSAAAAGVAAGAAAIAVKELADFLIQGALASEKARVETEKLGAALNNQGFSADALVPKYKALTDALQDATGIGNDEWLPVLTKLTQFGSTPESVGMDVNVVKSLAGFLGDVSGATMAWGKALQGNFTILSRYGIHVDEAASHLEKLRQAEEQIHRRGAGQLESENSGLTGRLKQIKNEAGDVAKTLGAMALAIDSNAGAFGFQGYIENLTNFSRLVRGEFRRIGEEAAQPVDLAAAVQARAEPSGKAFERTQDAIAKAAEKANRALERQVAAIRGVQSAQDEISDAQMALKLAEVDASEKTGGITPIRAIAARNKIRQQAAIARYQHLEAANMNEIMLIREQREDANQQILDLEAAIEKARSERDFETLNSARKRLEEVQEKKAGGVAREQALTLQTVTAADVTQMGNQALVVGARAELEMARDAQARDAAAAARFRGQRAGLSRDLGTRLAGRDIISGADQAEAAINLRRASTPEARAKLEAEAALKAEQAQREKDQDLQRELDKAKRAGSRHTTDIRAVGAEVQRGLDGFAAATTDTLSTLADQLAAQARRMGEIESRFANARV